jgi:hypothetical protein
MAKFLSRFQRRLDTACWVLIFNHLLIRHAVVMQIAVLGAHALHERRCIFLPSHRRKEILSHIELM